MQLEMKNITADTNEFQKITRHYCANIYFNKLDNLSEMYKLSAKYRLPKLTQKYINSLKRQIAVSKIKPVMKTPKTKKSPRED